MTFDHDLSNMAVDEARLWIYLHLDSIRTNILADQAGRLGFHSLQAAQDWSCYCEAAKDATGTAGVRGYPGMWDN